MPTDTAHTVLIIEARDLTVEEYEQLGAAVMGAMLPLGLADRLPYDVDRALGVPDAD